MRVICIMRNIRETFFQWESNEDSCCVNTAFWPVPKSGVCVQAAFIPDAYTTTISQSSRVDPGANGCWVGT